MDEVIEERYSKYVPYTYDEFKQKPENKMYGRSDILKKILFLKVVDEFLKKVFVKDNIYIEMEIFSVHQ